MWRKTLAFFQREEILTLKKTHQIEEFYYQQIQLWQDFFQDFEILKFLKGSRVLGTKSMKDRIEQDFIFQGF